MKKIFTLLLSVGIFSASFAQSNYQKNQYDRNDQYATASNGHDDNHYDRQYDNHRGQYDNNRRDYDHNRDQYDNRGQYDNDRNYSYQNQQALEIQRINQDFNDKVISIENNRFIRNREKKMAIRNAQIQRDQQIQSITANYGHMDQYNGRR